MRKTCRLCGSDKLETYLDLGLHPPSDAFTKTRDEPQIYYPLNVNLCRSCGHSQLGYVVPPEILFGEDYPYEANTTAAGRAHWAEFAATAVSRYGSGTVVDIGGNVGALCSEFAKQGCRVINVEPAKSVADISIENGIGTVNAFWSWPVADRLLDGHGPVQFVTATNVFAHVDDLDDFCRGVKRLLHRNGVFVIEAPWFRNLLAMNEWDTIYHEHLSYITITPLIPFFARHGLQVFNVEEAQIHGGSIRIWVGHDGAHPVKKTVTEAVSAERAAGTADLRRLAEFSAEVAFNRRALQEIVWKEFGSLACVSAPAKGMTLLNYCGFGRNEVAFASEKSQLKIGKFTPGGQIPVVSDAEFLERAPRTALLLAWNWAEEIISGLKEYRGSWIIPVPRPRLVSSPSSTQPVAVPRSA